MVEQIGDDILVKRSLGGDREAFRALVERYEGRVYSLAFEMLKSTEDARDIAQESFVKAYFSLKDFRGECSFYSWLYRIVYNMTVDFKRRVARRGGDTAEFDESAYAGGGAIGGWMEAPHESLVRREQRRHIRKAFEELSEVHRVVLMLREVDGLSYEEIAEVTGVSRGTVMSRLHYARKKMQAVLSQYDPELGQAASGRSGEGDSFFDGEQSDDTSERNKKLNMMYAIPAQGGR